MCLYAYVVNQIISSRISFATEIRDCTCCPKTRMFLASLQPNTAQRMPLLLSTHPSADSVFGLWQIAESEAFFRADLPLSADEEADLAMHQNPLRRMEWLAGRWLLHKLTDEPQRLPLAKDAFSKPFFPENQHLACSLSHSKGLVGALILDASHPEPHPLAAVPLPPSIGCDIQVLTLKMPKIAHKFLNVPEKEFVEMMPKGQHLDLLHLYWTAKESLYKAYGLKALDFREHIFVHNIRWDGFEGEGLGRVEKGEFRQEFKLIFSKVTLPDEAALIWAVCLGQ